MSSKTPVYQNLDTTFVNLWSLLRKLTAEGFIGRVHVDLKDYSADVFLDGSTTPVVREVDRLAQTETIEAGTLHRVVLRARETPGLINVFEGTDEARVPTAAPLPPPPSELQIPVVSLPAAVEESSPINLAEPTEPEPESPALPTQAAENEEGVYRAGSYQDWSTILAVTGELIAAVERGTRAAGGDFTTLFQQVRVELADDYTFLDPFTRSFSYDGRVVSLKSEPEVSTFVSAISEALRRVVDRIAIGDRARRVRERIALEMFPVARQRADALERSGLQAQLDRIAGTRVM
jgi:hypothetical protein